MEHMGMTYEEWVKSVYAHIRMLGIAHAKKSVRRDYPEKADEILKDAIDRLKKEFPKTDVEKSFR